jgi:3-phosphoshikimate 1-carboxyvinyltransferase
VTTVRVAPGVLRGAIEAPPSKSYTHRALVAAHLAGRRFAVDNPLDSDDTRATARALRSLGSTVSFSAHRWVVAPRSRPARGSATIDCGESGTTLRFVTALAARSSRPAVLSGRGRLPFRPIEELFDALESLGAKCERPVGARSLPARILGPVAGGSVRLNASRSSQFVSALLLTLPTVPGDSSIDLVGDVVSEPYIDATLEVLARHRVRATRRGRRFSIPGGQHYHGARMSVPGDASSAAYLWAAGALTGGPVEVRGVPPHWPQADLAILDLLGKAGAKVRRSSQGATVSGSALRGFTVDLGDAPDLYPLAGALAATIPATSRITGAAHVVLKESDRREGTRRLALALGAEVTSAGEGLVIRGTARPRAFRLTGLTDHRLVMSAGIAALVASSTSTIEDASTVSKSFPGFWSTLAALRAGSGS